MIRFDDLNREERYFSATILPYLLSYNNFNGLKMFFDYLNKNCFKDNKLDIYNFSEKLYTVQLITEPNLERDLTYHKIIIPSECFLKKKNKQCKPDLLIIYDDWSILLEVKLFSKYTEYSLEEQMLEQSYILDIIKKLSNDFIKNIFQIAVCPYEYKLKSFELITFKDIYQIFEINMPKEDYFMKRLSFVLN